MSKLHETYNSEPPGLCGKCAYLRRAGYKAGASKYCCELTKHERALSDNPYWCRKYMPQKTPAADRRD